MRSLTPFFAAWWMVIVLLGSSAMGTVVGGQQLVCPACGKKFLSPGVASTTTIGSDEEGRPITMGMDTQEFRLHDCPYCHYSGFGMDFDPDGGIPKDASLARVRDALARNKATFPAGALWPLERVRSSEICLIAREASAYRLEQLYRLGAWLADDAGEDALALEYRRKAAQQLLAAAGFGERDGAEYVTAINDYWSGKFSDALPKFKSARPVLEAQIRTQQPQWRNVRNQIIKRIRTANAGADAAPQTQPSPDAEDDPDLDYDELLGQASADERAVIFRRLSARHLMFTLDFMQHVAELGQLGPEPAYQKAKAGKLDDRRDFVLAFGRHSTPAIVSQITSLVRTDSDDPDAARDSNYLDMLRSQIGVADVDAPPVDLAKWTKILKAPDDDAARDLRSSVIAWLAQARSPEAASALLADLPSHPRDYADFPLVGEGQNDAWRTMALDPGKAVKVAQAAWAGAVQGQENIVAQLSLRPLAYCSDEASLNLLRAAIAPAVHSTIRLEAARCLIVRQKHEGAAELILLAGNDDAILPAVEADLGAKFIALITRDDLPALLKVRERWSGPIQRKDDDRKAMAAVLVRAALAKAERQRFMADYDKAVEELLSSDITGHEPAHLPWEDTVPEQLRLLGWCGNLFFTTHINEQLRPLLRVGVSEYGLSTTIDLLINAGAQDDNDLLAEQFARPVPLQVKLSLLRARKALHISGQDGIVARWATSSHLSLATAAKAQEK